MLSSYIDPANIPRKYGGTLDFGWGDMPNLDPVIRDTADWEGPAAKENPAFPKGPAYWRPIDGGKRLECVAVGSVDKVERCVRVCTIPVAVPVGEAAQAEGGAAAVVNGAAVPAVTTTEAKDAPPPAPAADSAAPAVAAAPEPSALGAAAATTTAPATDPVSPGDEEFKTPLGSPLVSATQELSLQDEKKPNGDAAAAVSEKVGEAEAVPNGKPVVAS